jgi:hypothetical protein
MMKLFKTATATKKAIYKIVAPITTGFFTDNSWESVNLIWKTLRNEGVELDITNAVYDGQRSKTWEFTVKINGFEFTGRLVACFCGTIQDPTNRYDLCFVI